MIIEISKNLRWQQYFANGDELASIMGMDRKNKRRVTTYPQEKKKFVHAFLNPVLLTDNHRICQLPPTVRDTIFSLNASRPRIVKYDGVSVFWDDSHTSVWCPSIDTVLFAKALQKVFRSHKSLKTGVEIGCGSGFLSKYVLEKCPQLISMLVVDINPKAIKCATDNIDDHRALYYIGDGLIKIRGSKFDLMICNPPYVPRPKSIDDNPYEGVGVLNELMHNGQKYLNDGGVLVLNISSLCWNLVMKKQPSMKMKVLAQMEVPLKVNNILNNKSWLKYLEKQGLKKQYRDGYEYWQTLYIVAFQK